MNFIQFYSFSVCFIFLCTVLSCNSQSICDVAGCVGINPLSTIYEFCNGAGRHINHSCCFDENSKTLVGLDLNGCSIPDTSKYIHTLTSVQYMSLRGSDVNCSTNNFKGMVNLTNLWLSDKCNSTCPGGVTAWRHETSSKCENQIDLCDYYNFTCSDDSSSRSSCTNNGPGLFHCVCTPPFSGYKCMINGEFPVTIFAATLSSATVVTSAVIWFLTLRKTKYVTIEANQ